MRKIKFRAWEKSVRGLDAGGMMWQSDETFKDYVVGFDGSVYEKFKDSFAGKSFDNYRDVSDKFILMQYTGLKDKNGREIYEGDVVQVNKTKGDPFAGNKGVVEFNPEIGCFEVRATPTAASVLYAYESILKDCKVIGNIYEDPELLT